MIEKVFTCPYCKEGQVRALHQEPIRKSTKVKKGMSVATTSAEVFMVLDDCPKCSKTKNEIQRALKAGGVAISHEQRLKRLLDSGLPTKFESVK